MKKILLIVAISIAVIIAIVAFAVSPIAKHFLINNSKELIGRKIDMENLSVNIFTGRLQVENFTLYEADDSTSFVAFDLFDVNMNLHKLLSKTAEIESVELSGADIRVIQNGNIFNFTDIPGSSDATRKRLQRFSRSRNRGTIRDNLHKGKRSSYGKI